MPAQKRTSEENESLLQQNLTNEDKNNNENSDSNNHLPQQEDDDEVVEADGHESDSDMDPSAYGDKDGFITVKLSDIRKEVQCPICLGIIRKTRTVMECLHRFCRECIDKSMRMGNNECPACRTHCASRRSLRDDPNYDALIAALYPDIDKYEEEELALQEEEVARNKQIQASIAQTIKRQADAAFGRKRTSKRTAAVIVRRSKNLCRDTHKRSRRNSQSSEVQGSDDNEDGNGDGGKDSSSADERSAEVTPKRGRRWGGRLAQSSSAAPSADKGGDENDSEATKESMGLSAVFVSSDRLAWGKGGIRSHTRHGSASGGNGKSSRNSRNSKLIDHFKSLEDDNPEMSLILVSLNEQVMPNLKEPYICCSPTLSVGQLCQYIAFQIGVKEDEIELYVVTELHAELYASTSMSSSNPQLIQVDPCKDSLRVLEEQETIEGLKVHICFIGHVVLGYQKKSQTTSS